MESNWKKSSVDTCNDDKLNKIGMTEKRKKFVQRLEKVLFNPLNEVTIKLYHDRNADFTDCDHWVNITDQWIPCKKTTMNESINSYYLPSLKITLKLPTTRIYKRLRVKFDFFYINANSITKYGNLLYNNNN